MQAGAAGVTAARRGGGAAGTLAWSARPRRVGYTFRSEATVLREKSVEAITGTDRAGAGSRGAVPGSPVAVRALGPVRRVSRWSSRRGSV
jgi:hypothetical protein